jgi:hypothetical protein
MKQATLFYAERNLKRLCSPFRPSETLKFIRGGSMDARRIRIFFSDPNATVSFFNNDPTSDACTTTKSAGKTEIMILQCNSRTNKSAKMELPGVVELKQ